MFDLEQAKQDLEEQKRLIKSMLGGINEFLEREDVTDIMFNQDGYIWIDTYTGTEKTIKIKKVNNKKKPDHRQWGSGFYITRD